MAKRGQKADKAFLYTVLILVGAGVAMFVSASLGLLARDRAVFTSVLFNQLVLGLGLGLFGMYLTYKIPYQFWRKYAFFIFLGALLLTIAVLIPSLGFSHGGARRWLSLGPVSFQPVEILKFGFVIYFAAWLAWVKSKAHRFKYGILPFLIIIAIMGAILLQQPDTKSLILMIVTGAAMLFVSGVPIRSLVGSGLLIIACLGILVYFTPYLKDRVMTYVAPVDQQGSAWQIKQSLIAIGSGGVAGRGYGQSIQKFTYLPEAQGDSIFAVLGEEFGFIGTLATVFLYSFFVLRGLKIANRASDLFGRLLVSGIVILIGAQAFMHIAAIVGIFPLTGVPLPFMSHGGTSLMIYLASVGIVVQVSALRGRSS